MGRGLKLIGFPYVSTFRDRHGKVRYRYRRAGQKAIYLHGTPGSPEFALEYDAACAGRTTALVPGASRTTSGTIHALAVAIYASAEWRLLSKATQSTYRGIIERLRTDYGDQSVRAIQPQHILKMRDKRVQAPTAANNLVKVLRWMLAFAMARQWRVDNPAVGIRPLKVVSAQRSGDVRQMGRQQVRDGAILVRQEKTKAFLELPIHPRLKASADTVPVGQLLFLTTQAGAGFTAGGFGNWFREACRSAGIEKRSAHGLRKSAATRLADAGCIEAQIKA